MHRLRLIAAAAATAALAAGTLVAVVAAHGGEEGLSIEPETIVAGQTAVLAGSGLEPDSDRLLTLVGQGMVVDLGTVTTDSAGMFEKEVTIPGHMPAGTYELQAIGDETLSVELTVTASGVSATPPPQDPALEDVLPRERSSLDIALILALVLISAVIGGVLTLRSEKIGRAFEA